MFTLRVKPRKKVVKWATERDFFLGYRFKKRNITKNENGVDIVHAPYVPVEQSTNHEFSLTFPEWDRVVKEYWDLVVDELTLGNTFELHRELGHLRFTKVNVRNVRKDKLFRNSHTLGYSPRVIWHRYKTAKFQHRMWYIFNISRAKQWSRVSKAIHKNPSLIFNYTDGLVYKKEK